MLERDTAAVAVKGSTVICSLATLQRCVRLFMNGEVRSRASSFRGRFPSEREGESEIPPPSLRQIELQNQDCHHNTDSLPKSTVRINQLVHWLDCKLDKLSLRCETVTSFGCDQNSANVARATRKKTWSNEASYHRHHDNLSVLYNVGQLVGRRALVLTGTGGVIPRSVYIDLSPIKHYVSKTENSNNKRSRTH